MDMDRGMYIASIMGMAVGVCRYYGHDHRVYIGITMVIFHTFSYSHYYWHVHTPLKRIYDHCYRLQTL